MYGELYLMLAWLTPFTLSWMLKAYLLVDWGIWWGVHRPGSVSASLSHPGGTRGMSAFQPGSGCGIMKKNTYLIFVPGSWHRGPKILGIS